MDADHPAALSDQNLEIEETVRTQRGRLLNFIRSRVGDEDDAQDILQDVFGELITAYRRLDTVERVTAWLFRVTRNKIIDTYRKRTHDPGFGPSRARDGDGAVERDGPEITLEELLPDLSANPEELFLRDAVWDAIQTTLDELPLVQRQAWVWHELDGLSFRQISERTGETENALRLRKHYASQVLRGRLALLGNAV